MFVACGLNHKTAPLEIREKVALPIALQTDLLNSLTNLATVNEAAILSTCNRTEIYCDTDDPSMIVPWLAREHQLSPALLEPYFYLHQADQGIRHTLRVASGLDSMMLGEPQILGQMKQAYHHACEAGTVKNNLRQVFEYVFSASKRIRNHSGIGNNPVSIAFAAVQLIRKIFKQDKALSVFIIGSGEMASLVGKYLYKEGVRKFMVASRSPESAQRLAQVFSGTALTISDISNYLSEADIIISATTCPLPFINQTMVKEALHKRNHAPLFFLDLAVPRDIEPNVGELECAHLFNIDDLQHMIEEGMNERRHAAVQAEQLINFELEQYIRWHRSLKADGIICRYREKMDALAQEELQRALQKLANGQTQEQVLSEFSHRLVNKLVHTPSAGFRQVAGDKREDLLDLAQYLFNLADTTSS